MRLFVPERLWELRNEREIAEGRDPLPEYNPFGDDYTIKLNGVRENAVVDALSRSAREGGSAFVALTSHTSMASLRLTSRIIPESYRWRRSPFGDPAEARSAMIRVRAYSLGWNRQTEFPIPIETHDQRMSLEAGLVDRRGVKG